MRTPPRSSGWPGRRRTCASSLRRSRPRSSGGSRLRGQRDRHVALSILVRSYDRMGLDQLRDDAERVMRTNYPKSALLSGEGIRSAKKSWWQMW